MRSIEKYKRSGINLFISGPFCASRDAANAAIEAERSGVEMLLIAGI
jgi:hypothetical protein